MASPTRHKQGDQPTVSVQALQFNGASLGHCNRPMAVSPRHQRCNSHLVYRYHAKSIVSDVFENYSCVEPAQPKGVTITLTCEDPFQSGTNDDTWRTIRQSESTFSGAGKTNCFKCEAAKTPLCSNLTQHSRLVTTATPKDSNDPSN
jgi:hypothetical protein